MKGKESYSRLLNKSKKELIDEIIDLTNKNGNGKSYYFKNFNLESTLELDKLIIENARDGIMIIGDNFNVDYVNETFMKLTGYDKENILDQNFKKIIKKSNLDFPFQIFNNLTNGIEINSTLELPFTDIDKNEKMFEVTVNAFENSSQSAKILLQFRDITARKLAEEAIRQSEEKYRSIVEHSDLGILIIGMDYRFEYVNDQLCKILNSSKKNLIGADFRKFLSEESLEIVVDRYLKRQKGENVPSEYKLTLLRETGEKRIAKITSSTVNFAGNVKTIAQLLDITEKEKKQNLQSVILKISQAVNEVSNLHEFLATVRNELSTVLDTSNFYVALYDKNSDTYTFPYHADEYDSIDEITQIELKDSLTDYVRRKNKAILVDSAVQADLEEAGEIIGIVGESCPVWIGAPLVVENEVVGAICLQNYHNADTYNSSDLELLKIISENVSSAIWKKQLFDKLSESELRYRDFISRSSEGIYRIDFEPAIDISLSPEEQVNQMLNNGIIGECNNAFAKMYDMNSYKNVLGKRMYFFYGENVSQKNIDANLEFIKNDYRIDNVETTELNSKGEEIVILNNSMGIIKDGCLQNVWGMQKDITESNRLSKVLQQIAKGVSSFTGDSFFKSLVKFLGNTLSADYVIISELSSDKETAESLAVWGNNKFIENFSFDIKNTPSQIILKENNTIFFNNINENFPDDNFLLEHKIKNYMGKALVNSKGEPIGILAILMKEDLGNIEFTRSVLEIFASRSAAEIERLQYLKEIVKAKEEAERSNNLKSDFLAQMSHEIRTPVNTILSFSSLLKESLNDKLEDDLKDSFKIIENGGQRLIRTIDLILNVSQIQSGNLSLSPTQIDLVQIINNLISEFKQTANNKDLQLLFKSNYSNLFINADNYTITQIFANLIHNGIKYTDKGSIELSAHKNGKDEIIVTVSDTGVGMSEDYLKELFDPFSQEETGYTRKFEGTGLGLTLVRKYCELNNAEIIVNSRKNEGSTFIVKFPKLNLN